MKRVRIFGLVIALFTVAQVRAQEDFNEGVIGPPDYDAIAQRIQDMSSPYYYPNLMKRYQLGDTTLTVEDFRHLYYGYPTQPDYRPLLESPYTDSLKRAFGRKTSPTAEDYRRVVDLAYQVLKDEPFSMRDLNVLAFAYQMLDERELAERQFFKMQGVMDAILSTGTGLSEDSPWYITYMRDAEDILNLMQYKSTRMIIVSKSVGFTSVSNMPTKQYKGFYFDYSEVYKRRPDYLDDIKKNRKMEVNPLYNPKSKMNTLPK